MNTTLAFSLNTIQICDGTVYGTTVLGGNIMKAEMDGKASIVWENDYADQSKGGVFLYSVHHKDTIYFFPFMSEYIIAYNYKENTISKTRFDDKEIDERIYAQLHGDRIIMIGLKTGRVWELADQIKDINTERRGEVNLIKQRNGIEKEMAFFVNQGASTIFAYDFRNNKWSLIEICDDVKNGIFEEGYVWYASNGWIHKHEIVSDEDVSIVRFGDCEEASIVRIGNKKMLIVPRKGDKQFLIDKDTLSIEVLHMNFYADEHLHYTVSLDDNHIFLASIVELDWMFQKCDKYAICGVKNMIPTEIQMFDTDSNTASIVKSRFESFCYNIMANGLVYESRRISLDFFLNCWVDKLNY